MKFNWKKLGYFADEVFVFSILVLSILFSTAILTMIKNGDINKGQFHVDITKAIVCSLIAILVAGSMHNSWTYSEGKKKPPMAQRLHDAIIYGISYRTLLGVDN